MWDSGAVRSGKAERGSDRTYRFHCPLTWGETANRLVLCARELGFVEQVNVANNIDVARPIDHESEVTLARHLLEARHAGG